MGLFCMILWTTIAVEACCNQAGVLLREITTGTQTTPSMKLIAIPGHIRYDTIYRINVSIVNITAPGLPNPSEAYMIGSKRLLFSYNVHLSPNAALL